MAEGRLSRTDARTQALELLYEAEVRNQPVDALIESMALHCDAYTRELVQLYQDNSQRVDGLIEQNLDRRWSLGRLARLDLAVLRVAVAELLGGQVPTSAVLAEATKLTAEYSAESSTSFVNGILAKIADSLD